MLFLCLIVSILFNNEIVVEWNTNLYNAVLEIKLGNPSTKSQALDLFEEQISKGRFDAETFQILAKASFNEKDQSLNSTAFQLAQKHNIDASSFEKWLLS